MTNGKVSGRIARFCWETGQVIEAHQSVRNKLNGQNQSFWVNITVGAAIVFMLILSLNALVVQRFHHDEALYATWARFIATGENVWLTEVPIDKPPLFLYVVAGSMILLGVTESAARVPSLLASVLIVILTYNLGKKMYGMVVGLTAACLIALSPFTILFAPTALTDPLLVAFILAGCVAAIGGRPMLTGLALGLAIATKQQGVFFAPLLFALLQFSPKFEARSVSDRLTPTVYLGLMAGLVVALTFAWDGARQQSPGYWQMSLVNYGGLSAAQGDLFVRGTEFIELLKYGLASSVLNWIFLVGIPLLLFFQRWVRPNEVFRWHHLRFDWILTLFIILFVGGHIIFSFQVWDRYLLGLIPLIALLFARILWLPWARLQRLWSNKVVLTVASLSIAILLLFTLPNSIQDTVNGRYPLGSNSAALNGLDQTVAYLQGQAGANNTLYHRWLGTHWRFYLADYPYDLQHWTSAQMLANKAQSGHFIAFPAWRSETEARLALAEVGLHLVPVNRAYHPTGQPTITLYRIEGEDKP